MKRLRIEIGEKNVILRGRSKKVERVKGEIIKEMKRIIREEEALGLAAPQVGINERFFVMRVGGEEKGGGEIYKFLVCVNPEVRESGGGEKVAEEGCLSLPGVTEKVKRAGEVVVEFEDERGGKRCLRLEGLDARVFQHEFDHLEGRLIVD